MGKVKKARKSLRQIIEEQALIIEVLRAENAYLRAELAKRDETIARLNERIAELERRLGLDSNNSSKPPSSDGLKKQPSRTQSLREKSGKKSGGQPGHEGTTLRQVEKPDKIHQHKTACCPNCACNLSEVSITGVCKRQVFDVPLIQKPIVTEHQFEIKQCPHCQKKVMAKIDGIAETPVQYGPNVKALITYLHVYNLVPIDRITQIIDDCYGIQMSESTVIAIIESCATNVGPVVEQIEEELKTAHVRGSDESGLRVSGKTGWLHALCNERLVHYRFSEKRGDVPEDLAGGVLVHDHFISYYAKLDDKVSHALCNAHHLRELKAVAEIDKEPWAKNMMRLLRLGCCVATNKDKEITDEWRERFIRLYNQIIFAGLDYHAKLEPLKRSGRGRIKHRPGHNLLLRLHNRANDVLRFLYDSEVPFTNNLSEQSLRMIKVKQKISGCFRTINGVHKFLVIRSYIATAKKQGRKIIDLLVSAFSGPPIDLLVAGGT